MKDPIYPGDRFYFQNVKEELNRPGEWYFDRQDRTLRLCPPGPMEGAVVTVPTAESIISVQGLPRAAAERRGHLRFRGFVFDGCDRTAITIRDAAACRIEQCVIRNAGEIAWRNSMIARPGTVDVAVLAPIDVSAWDPADLDAEVEKVRQLYLDTLLDWPKSADHPE